MSNWQDEDLEAAEADLIRKAKLGDTDAYGQLYQAYAAQVFRFIYSHIDNSQDAEDLTSEVFVRAWRSLAGYRQRGLPFKAFLFRVARNLVIDQYRQRQRSFAEVTLDEDFTSTSIPDPDVVVQQLQDVRELRQTLAKLREEYRTVLVMRFLSGLSPEETAQAMSKSVGAVRVLQHRALNALRELMDRE